jgi:hypothetical protein
MATLLTVSSGTTDGTDSLSIVTHPEAVRSAMFLLSTTPGSTANGASTLDVYVQSSVDGTNYNDFVAFTQIPSTGGASNVQQASWVRDVTPTTPQGTLNDAALAAGVVQGPIGSTWRAKYVVSATSGPMSFTLYANLTR